jgi:phage terminase small subunit
MNKKIKEIIEALEFMGKTGDVSKIAVKCLKNALEELDEQLTLTDVVDKLKDKEGTDFEEFCSKYFIYKNSNTYSKESGLPVSLSDMLQKYKDLKHNL